jgi:hypothetical protein
MMFGSSLPPRALKMDWQIRFRRMVGAQEALAWAELQLLLGSLNITRIDDVIEWGLSPSKSFTTSSLYKFLAHGGVNSRMAKKIWKCKIPIKIKIFLWQTFQNRIQTATQLCAMN